MPRHGHVTLTQFLIDERRRFPSASGDFNSLILDVGTAARPLPARWLTAISNSFTAPMKTLR